MKKKPEYIIVRTSTLEDGSEWIDHLFSFDTKENALDFISYVEKSATYDHELHVAIRRGNRVYDLDEEVVDE